MGVVFDGLRSTGHGMPFFFTLGLAVLFWGGIVFGDVLGILDAALSRLFGLTTNRTLEPSVPTLWNTHCEWVLFLTVCLLAGCLRVAVG